MIKKGPISQLIRIIILQGLEYFNRYYATYYGYVLENEDPDNMNRIFVWVPEVMGAKERGIWAYPKSQFGGNGYGINLVPQKNDMVFITYRHGHPRYPLWQHGNYAKGEKPSEFNSPNIYGFKTPKGSVLIINDDTEEVSIKNPDGEYILLSKDQLFIKYKDASLKFQDNVVTINGGTYGGLVKVNDLFNKVNRLEQAFNQHTHSGVSSGNSNTAIPLNLITPLTQLSDLENQNVKH